MDSGQICASGIGRPLIRAWLLVLGPGATSLFARSLHDADDDSEALNSNRVNRTMSAPHLLPQHPMHVPFRSAPVTHAPSPFGFGFGLSNQASTSSMAPHYNVVSGAAQHSAYQHANSITSHNPFSSLGQQSHARAAGANSTPRSNAKRRHDDSGDAESREDSNMNARSPSPDRPRRVVTKRLRATDAESGTKSKAAETQDSQANVDVGVLLGRFDDWIEYDSAYLFIS
jgi:hypothetical protein